MGCSHILLIIAFMFLLTVSGAFEEVCTSGQCPSTGTAGLSLMQKPAAMASALHKVQANPDLEVAESNTQDGQEDISIEKQKKGNELIEKHVMEYYPEFQDYDDTRRRHYALQLWEKPECDRGNVIIGNGEWYRGCQSVTHLGYTCQKWTSQSPHKHTRYPEHKCRAGSCFNDAGLGDHNYCRNPDGESMIWCYTTDPGKRWDYCYPVGKCVGEMSGRHGVDYRGCQTKTRSGYSCQKWTSKFPHWHRITWRRYPHKGIGDHNYCRNPDGEPTIWCYTTSPGKRWDYCNPICNEELEGTCIGDPKGGWWESDGKGLNRWKEPGRRCTGYRGCQTKTRKGHTCMAWDKTVEGGYYNDGQLVHNYCRMPVHAIPFSSRSSVNIRISIKSDRSGWHEVRPSTIWCYTAERAHTWEWDYCDPIQ